MALHAVCFGVIAVTRLDSPVIATIFGLLLLLAAEGLRASRFAGNGSDAAVSFWAIVYVVVGAGLPVEARRATPWIRRSRSLRF